MSERFAFTLAAKALKVGDRFLGGQLNDFEITRVSTSAIGRAHIKASGSWSSVELYLPPDKQVAVTRVVGEKKQPESRVDLDEVSVDELYEFFYRQLPINLPERRRDTLATRFLEQFAESYVALKKRSEVSVGGRKGELRVEGGLFKHQPTPEPGASSDALMPRDRFDELLDRVRKRASATYANRNISDIAELLVRLAEKVQEAQS